MTTIGARGSILGALIMTLLACACSSQMRVSDPESSGGAGAGGSGFGGLGGEGNKGLGGAGSGGTMGEFAGFMGTLADGGSPCVGQSSSTMPGVSLTFTNVQCVYTLAQAANGIRLDYSLAVAHDVTQVHPQAQDLGHCQQPRSSGLIVAYTISGGGQSYCLCDTGFCPAQTPTTTAHAGTYDDEIVWDGRNWGGPSDTLRPEGNPFPPGTYSLTVSTIGTYHDPTIDGGVGGQPPDQVNYVVWATRGITLTP